MLIGLAEHGKMQQWWQMWREVRFFVMASSKETVLFMRQIWKQG